MRREDDLLDSRPPHVLFQLTNVRHIEDCFLAQWTLVLKFWNVRFEQYCNKNRNLYASWRWIFWNLGLKTFYFQEIYLRRIEDCFLDSGTRILHSGISAVRSIRNCNKSRNFNASWRWSSQRIWNLGLHTFDYHEVLCATSRIVSWTLVLEFWNVRFEQYCNKSRNLHASWRWIYWNLGLKTFYFQ